MTIVQHLEELRYRLVVSVAAVAVGSIAGWVVFDRALTALRGPYCDALAALPPSSRPPTGCKLVFNGPVEPFVVKLKLVLFIGLALALPIVLYEFWRFVTPGLTKRERRLGIPFVVSSVALFALGGWFAYLTLPRGLQFLLGFAGPGTVPLLTAGRYISFVIFMTLAFGLAFEFPIVLIFLSLVGVTSSAALRRWRRYAVLVIAIVAAIITPSQDPYTMLAMMIPMAVFYELAILVARLLKR
jgi:sec-independent protein translocase protein TatC